LIERQRLKISVSMNGDRLGEIVVKDPCSENGNCDQKSEAEQYNF
jgi:hypothetical protein